jgi:hypothetical protein
MSDNKTSSFAVKLLKAHTHAGKAYPAGETIAADKINQIVADWLVDNKVGEKVDAGTTAKPPLAAVAAAATPPKTDKE